MVNQGVNPCPRSHAKERKKERKETKNRATSEREEEIRRREVASPGPARRQHAGEASWPLGRRKLAPRSRATVVKAAGSWALTESRRGSQREGGEGEGDERDGEEEYGRDLGPSFLPLAALPDNDVEEAQGSSICR